MKHFVVLAYCLLSLFTVQRGNAQWTLTNGPYGGKVRAFATDGTILYAGTDQGVFRSDDQGTTWKSENSGLYNTHINALTLIGSCVFAATDTGVFRSTDSGSMWQHASNGPRNRDDSYALTSIGSQLFSSNGRDTVYRSSDSGKSWRKTGNQLQWRTINTLFAWNFMLFAGTDSGVYRSTDEGIAWVRIDSNGSPGWVLSFTTCEKYLLAGTYGVVKPGSVFRSSDSGYSWQRCDVGLPAASNFNALASEGEIVVVGCDSGTYYSSDSGKSWHPTALPYTATALILFRSVIFAGTWGSGIFATSDTGKIWVSTGPSRSKTYVTLLGGRLLCGSSHTVYSSSDNGDPYSGMFGMFDSIGSTLFTVSDSVYLSSDNGKHWKATGPILNQPIYGFLANGNSLYAAVPNRGLYYSRDSGATWSMGQNPFITSAPGRAWSVRTICAIGNVLFAGGILSYDNFNSHNYAGIFRSTDAGENWWPISFGLPTIQGSSIGVLASIGTSVFATYQGIYRSTDSGSTWTQVNVGLIDSSIGLFYTIGSHILAGGHGGAFLSNNNGDSWLNISPELQKGVGSFALVNPYLFIGTDSGVWRRPISEILSQSTMQKDVSVSSPIQLYPNPATTELRIESNAKAESVEVYDMLGRQVVLPPPTYSGGTIILAVGDLPTGMYYVKISDGRIIKFVKQ
jgi:photosystem II stability/assembly factor-like uncharacterized protein